MDAGVNAEKTRQTYAPKCKTNTFLKILSELKYVGIALRQQNLISSRYREFHWVWQMCTDFSNLFVYSFCYTLYQVELVCTVNAAVCCHRLGLSGKPRIRPLVHFGAPWIQRMYTECFWKARINFGARIVRTYAGSNVHISICQEMFNLCCEWKDAFIITVHSPSWWFFGRPACYVGLESTTDGTSPFLMWQSYCRM
jgi:hypothetical protein